MEVHDDADEINNQMIDKTLKMSIMQSHTHFLKIVKCWKNNIMSTAD